MMYSIRDWPDSFFFIILYSIRQGGGVWLFGGELLSVFVAYCCGEIFTP